MFHNHFLRNRYSGPRLWVKYVDRTHHTLIVLIVSYRNIGKLDISQTHHTERSRIILHLRVLFPTTSHPTIIPSHLNSNSSFASTQQTNYEWEESKKPHTHNPKLANPQHSPSMEMWILTSQLFGRNFIKNIKLNMKLYTLHTAVHFVRQNTTHANEICS